MFTDNSTASVAEGENATICISLNSSATTLGCDLTFNFATADGKAIGKILLHMSSAYFVYNVYIQFGL